MKKILRKLTKIKKILTKSPENYRILRTKIRTKWGSTVQKLRTSRASVIAKCSYKKKKCIALYQPQHHQSQLRTPKGIWVLWTLKKFTFLCLGDQEISLGPKYQRNGCCDHFLLKEIFDLSSHYTSNIDDREKLDKFDNAK